jgi:hypothetical protein
MILSPWIKVQFLVSNKLHTYNIIISLARILEPGEVPAQTIRKRVELLSPSVVLVGLELLPPMPATVLPHTRFPVEVGAVQEIGYYGSHRRWWDHIDHYIELQRHKGGSSECESKKNMDVTLLLSTHTTTECVWTGPNPKNISCTRKYCGMVSPKNKEMPSMNFVLRVLRLLYWRRLRPAPAVSNRKQVSELRVWKFRSPQYGVVKLVKFRSHLDKSTQLIMGDLYEYESSGVHSMAQFDLTCTSLISVL